MQGGGGWADNCRYLCYACMMSPLFVYRALGVSSSCNRLPQSLGLSWCVLGIQCHTMQGGGGWADNCRYLCYACMMPAVCVYAVGFAVMCGSSLAAPGGGGQPALRYDTSIWARALGVFSSCKGPLV